MSFNIASDEGAKVGIAIITYNRLQSLKECVDAVRLNTKTGYALVACDDGSTDGSQQWLRSEGIPVVGGTNRGIAWNKNRGLYTLLQHTSAEVILLLEDDCAPCESHWLDFWFNAATKWGHVNLVHPQTARALAKGRTPDEILGGKGTVEDPFACMRISGLCIASSRSALTEIGYLDSRFKGYGHEHAEWTTRFRKAGYGIRNIVRNDAKVKANVMFSYGFRSLDYASQSDKSLVSSNKNIFQEGKNDTSIYRAPWRSAEERQTFLLDIGGPDVKEKVPSTSVGATPVIPTAYCASPAEAREWLMEGLRFRVHDFDEYWRTGNYSLQPIHGQAPTVAKPLSDREFARAVLTRSAIDMTDSRFRRFGFQSSENPTRSTLDANVDIALDTLVQGNHYVGRDPIGYDDVIAEDGSLKLLVSTRQTNTADIGFKGNVGDNYGLHAVRTLSRRTVRPYGVPLDDEQSVLMSVGSYMQHARNRALVWGTGCMAPMNWKVKAAPTRSNFRGVRGPRTREQVLLKFGINCPIIGDPGLLISKTNSRIRPVNGKKIGVVVHHVDYEFVKLQWPELNIIPNTISVDDMAGRLCECDAIISTSLHGLIFSHAFDIPCEIVKVGNRLSGSEFKFLDYMNSVGNYSYNNRIDISELRNLSIDNCRELAMNAFHPDVQSLQSRLVEYFPSKIVACY